MDGGDSNLSHNLNIPLIQDQTQRCHERNKNPQTDSSNGYATTSFLNTCFNGLNALSVCRSLSIYHMSPHLPEYCGDGGE
uniref:Uncharacterized protein n=1 Tax=Phaseolus vulgaris TaxID=3885 RepID=V7B0Y9_PHAVU|nr:hypothetical protein PHAVU_008G041000g [Phaseolus vulgaris]ESW11567.1 hypothetical protein PHAVU_008G041000g [Phaseolus vulgaris]